VNKDSSNAASVDKWMFNFYFKHLQFTQSFHFACVRWPGMVAIDQ
jgi:hypothetical protein